MEVICLNIELYDWQEEDKVDEAGNRRPTVRLTVSWTINGDFR